MKFCILGVTVSTIFLALAMPASGLTIIPTFDSSITNDPQATAIESSINEAIQVYAESFSDPITVTIEFTEMGGGLGASSFSYIFITYSSYLDALKSHATTAYDTNALAHLPDGPANPVNSNLVVSVTWPNARALGLIGDPAPGQPDGTIYLNISALNLNRSSVDPGKYDLISVASHEIDEVLGLFSALNGLTNGTPPPTDNIWPMDLFRYNQSQQGTRSFDTGLSTQAYFSLDGTNLLVRFNQTQGLDFGDWYGWVSGQVSQVQDSVTARAAPADLGIEKIALDVIGFKLVPSSLAPIFTSGTNSNGNFNVTWSSIPALRYQLQSTTNLASTTSWTNLGVPITATGTRTSASNPLETANQRFYRAVLLTP